MRSSTSSFKGEIMSLLLALAIVALLDLGERSRRAKRPYEYEALRKLPIKADELKTIAVPGRRVILMGNSLCQNGYDMTQLRNEMAEPSPGSGSNETFTLLPIFFSGSSEVEWYHIFRRVFVNRQRVPDIVVINMSPVGLRDRLPENYRIPWLADETDWGDVPEVVLDDLRSFEIGAQFLQARMSSLYADKWDIRVGILGRVAPDIEKGMRWLNGGMLVAARQPDAQGPSPGKPFTTPPPTYWLMSKFIKLAAENHAKVLVVAMPVREPYEVDPGLLKLLSESKMGFLDCHKVPGLTPDLFEDGWHMNANAKPIFTSYMAAHLPPAMEELLGESVENAASK